MMRSNVINRKHTHKNLVWFTYGSGSLSSSSSSSYKGNRSSSFLFPSSSSSSKFVPQRSDTMTWSYGQQSFKIRLLDHVTMKDFTQSNGSWSTESIASDR